MEGRLQIIGMVLIGLSAIVALYQLPLDWPEQVGQFMNRHVYGSRFVKGLLLSLYVCRALHFMKNRLPFV